MKTQYRYTTLSIALAAALSACGGGGGNTRSDAPPPPPTTPPAPAVCEDENATNTGGLLPCTYRYSGRQDNLLVPVNADLAHGEGFTGKDVKVGVLDDALVPAYAPLEGTVAWQRNYVEGQPETKPGHGTVAATTLLGRATGDFDGGIAPDAQLYMATVCSDVGCDNTRAGEAIRDMGEQGVRIFNASYGGSSVESLDEAAARSYARVYRSLVDVDGLLVSSAGNDGGANPGTIAGMPVVDADFLGRYITAAAGAVDSKGNVTELAEFSNQCGFAAEWCITAPGLVSLPAVPGTEYVSGAQGTSIAAPIVAGAAALVLQAFPWMSARNMQQTILTTATDLGAPGVDAVFGWGLLNVDRAVRGPGQFQGADFVANVQGGNFAFTNDITGDAGLIKEGAGGLGLVGDHTYTGLTRVTAGALALTGTLASDVLVEAGARFGAYGATLGGDYTAEAGSITSVQVGDPLAVTGTATLAGELALRAAKGDYTVQDTETVLTGGTVAGTFDQVTVDSGFFYSATLSYTDQSVIANLTRAKAAANAARMKSAQSVVDGAGQVDALFDFTDSLVLAGNTHGREALVAAAGRLMASDKATAELSLASLTGQVHGTVRAVGVQGALNTGNLLAQRVDALKGDAQDGVWIEANGTDGELARSGYATADYRQSGVTMGLDRNIGDAAVGIALSSGRNRAEIDALGGSYKGDRLGVAVYGRADFGPAYVSGSLAYEEVDVDTRREIVTGNASETVTAKREDASFHGRLEAGYQLGNGFSPFVAGGLIEHQQGAFAEDSQSGLGLAAGKDSATVGYADLGLRYFGTSGAFSYGGLIAGRTLLTGDRANFRGWFTGAPEASFIVAGQAIPSDALRIGGNASFRAANGWEWFGSIGGERASGQSDNVFGSLGVKVSF